MFNVFIRQKYNYFRMCKSFAHTLCYFAAENEGKQLLMMKNMSQKIEQHLIKSICAKMKKAGYDCKVVNGQLVISDGEKEYNVQMSEPQSLGRRRIKFFLEFAFSDMESMETAGLTLFTSECNNHCGNTTVLFLQDHFVCRFETSTRTANDFMREFDFARKKIDYTFMSMVKSYPAFHDQFQKPARNLRPIGFSADRYMPHEKNDDACKKVAHTGGNFAA